MSEFSFKEMNWKLGTTEVATLNVFFAVALGMPFFLYKPELLSLPTTTFYLFLFVIGFFGHTDDITQEGFKRLNSKEIWIAIGLGLVGFLIIQIMFFVGLTLLATTETILSISKWELLIFNLTFVVGAEELVFRDTLPFYISQVFGLKIDESYAVPFAFILSSVIFGAFHLFVYNYDLIAVVKAIIAGIVLSIIRIFGGLFASYLAHLTYNSLNILGLFILPALAGVMS